MNRAAELVRSRYIGAIIEQGTRFPADWHAFIKSFRITHPVLRCYDLAVRSVQGLLNKKKIQTISDVIPESYGLDRDRRMEKLG